MLGAKLSIRTILGSVIAIMGLLLVTASVIALVGVIGRHGEAQNVAARAPVSQQFFKSLQALRLERGNGVTGLKAPGEAEAGFIRDMLSERQVVEGGYAGGLKLLAGLDVPGLAASVAQLKSTHDA